MLNTEILSEDETINGKQQNEAKPLRRKQNVGYADLAIPVLFLADVGCVLAVSSSSSSGIFSFVRTTLNIQLYEW